jgi:hypothetical protein
MPMKPPQQLKTLNDLLAQAEHYAWFCMGNSGHMAPTLFLIGEKGPLMFCPRSLQDDDEKDAFADVARLLCIANNASAVVLTMEAWMKLAKPGENLDLSESPSEAFDRQEVVTLMGESRDGQKQKILNIVRSGNHKFFGLVDATPKCDSFGGRFARILPLQDSATEHRLLAEAMLKIRGVDIGKPGTTIRLTPRRR